MRIFLLVCFGSILFLASSALSLDVRAEDIYTTKFLVGTVLKGLPALIAIAAIATRWSVRAEDMATSIVGLNAPPEVRQALFARAIEFANAIGQPEGITILRKLVTHAIAGDTFALEALEKSDPRLLKRALQHPKNAFRGLVFGKGDRVWWLLDNATSGVGADNAHKLLGFVYDQRTIGHLRAPLNDSEKSLVARIRQENASSWI